MRECGKYNDNSNLIYILDLQETRAALDEVMRERANMEKNCKMTQGSIVEANTKLDEMARALNEADSTKKKLISEINFNINCKHIRRPDAALTL